MYRVTTYVKLHVNFERRYWLTNCLVQQRIVKTIILQEKQASCILWFHGWRLNCYYKEEQLQNKILYQTVIVQRQGMQVSFKICFVLRLNIFGDDNLENNIVTHLFLRTRRHHCNVDYRQNKTKQKNRKMRSKKKKQNKYKKKIVRYIYIYCHEKKLFSCKIAVIFTRYFPPVLYIFYLWLFFGIC